MLMLVTAPPDHPTSKAYELGVLTECKISLLIEGEDGFRYEFDPSQQTVPQRSQPQTLVRKNPARIQPQLQLVSDAEMSASTPQHMQTPDKEQSLVLSNKSPRSSLDSGISVSGTELINDAPYWDATYLDDMNLSWEMSQMVDGGSSTDDDVVGDCIQVANAVDTGSMLPLAIGYPQFALDYNNPLQQLEMAPPYQLSSWDWLMATTIPAPMSTSPFTSYGA